MDDIGIQLSRAGLKCLERFCYFAGTVSANTSAVAARVEDYCDLTKDESFMQTVNKAPLRVVADNAMRFFGDPNPTFSGTISGLKNSDLIAATYKYDCADD